MREPPGIKYPTLPSTVDRSVHEMSRNIFDNLFHLRKEVEGMQAKNGTPPTPNTTPTSGESPVQTLASGRYTPLLSNILNLDGSSAFECQYMRVGNTVSVSGRVDVNPTAAGTTQLSISLPVVSNFVNANDCAGAAACPSVAGQSASIQAEAGTNHALMQWVAVDTSNQSMFFMFLYSVL